MPPADDGGLAWCRCWWSGGAKRDRFLEVSKYVGCDKREENEGGGGELWERVITGS